MRNQIMKTNEQKEQEILEELDNIEQTEEVEEVEQQKYLHQNKNLKEAPKRRRRKVKKNNIKKKKNWVKRTFLTLFSLFIIGIVTVTVLLYGPIPNFRDWLITSAMTTMNHQYIATWFYNNKEIQEVLDKNKVVETGAITNPNDTTIEKIEEKEIKYENEYERAILQREDKTSDHKIINIEGKGYSGYLVAIYDPSKLKVVTTKKIGISGQYLVKMAEDNDAVLAINGGGFIDPNYSGDGGTPLGLTIVNGKVVTQNAYNGAGGLIGFTKENKLVLGKMTAKQAIDMGVRDGVTFGPFLIVNGVPSFIKGNGGWGTAPRTAIGQRKDGIVLLLVIDGRTIKRPGADMVDLTEIMTNYGAYNAANLDGGTSSALVVNNKLINDPIDSAGEHRTRAIATGIILTK